MHLRGAAAAVTGADIAHLGLEGPAFGEALRQARIAAIAAARTLRRDGGVSAPAVTAAPRS